MKKIIIWGVIFVGVILGLSMPFRKQLAYFMPKPLIKVVYFVSEPPVEYAFDLNVPHQSTMTDVKVVGNLTLRFRNEEDRKAFEKDSSYIREQKEILRVSELSEKQQMILLNSMLEVPDDIIRSAIKNVLTNVISNHDLQYIISHRENIEKEVSDSLEKELNIYAFVYDVSLAFQINKEYQKALEALQKAKEDKQKALEALQKAKEDTQEYQRQQQTQQQASSK